MRILIRLAINAVALWVAVNYLPGPPGIQVSDESVVTLLIVAAVFGLVNAFIKPIVRLLSLPARILTLGLFGLLINTAMLALTALILEQLTIDGFVSAFVGALVISIVSILLGFLLPDED